RLGPAPGGSRRPRGHRAARALDRRRIRGAVDGALGAGSRQPRHVRAPRFRARRADAAPLAPLRARMSAVRAQNRPAGAPAQPESVSRRLFLAGASGAIGRRLCRLLVADGWEVTGTTRSPEKAALLRALGVAPVVADVYDAEALARAVVAARPDVVIHQ